MSVSAFIIIILFKCMVFFSYNNRFWIDYFFLAMCHNEEKYQINLNNLPFCLYKYRAQKIVIILEYFQIWFIWWMMVLIFYSTSRHLLISFRSHDKWSKMDRYLLPNTGSLITQNFGPSKKLVEIEVGLLNIWNL